MFSGKADPATLPDLSPMLGRHFSGNGDFGAVTFRAERLTEPMKGPTITAASITATGSMATGSWSRTVAFPTFCGPICNLRREAWPSGRRLWRFLKDLFRGVGGRGLAEAVFDRLDFDAVRRCCPTW